MNDTDPQSPRCLPCRMKRHVGCLWRSRPDGCGCACPWLEADMLASFSSLRRQLIEENP